MEALIKIQSELKAPKNQYNSFGKYKYRNCEDILEAVKPLLLKYKCVLTISDKIAGSEQLMVIESTATITDGTNVISVTAHAGIDVNRKGMDIAQSFGASSSYARKYALNGLFLIDDTKDADATNTHGKEEKQPQKPKANEAIIRSMLSFIAEGKKDVVEQKMENYELTEAQRTTLEIALKK